MNLLWNIVWSSLEHWRPEKRQLFSVLVLPHVVDISKSRKFGQAYKFMDAHQLVVWYHSKSSCLATLVAFQIPIVSKTKMALHLHVISTPLSSERVTSFSYPRFPSMVRTRNALPARVKAVAERRESLDHLQRVSHNQQKQSQPKRRPEIASTGLWNRFPTARTVQQMMDTMERMMEDPFPYSSTLPLGSEGVRNGYGQGRTPWAIVERETDYKMRFDMPGMTKNDVKVWVEKNMLVVKAEKVPNSRDGQENVNGTETEEEWPAKSYGRYSSRIALPENIEFEKIKAEVKDGVLYVTVPKAGVSSKIVDIDVQ